MKMYEIPQSGYMRAKQIIGDLNAEPPVIPLIPVSKSTWWEGVKSGRYPKPIKFGSRITAWRIGDIRQLMETEARNSIMMTPLRINHTIYHINYR